MKVSVQALFDLKGRIAVVTGGAGHLGHAISEALAECGSLVFTASKNISKKHERFNALKAKFPKQIRALTLDIGSSEAIRAAFTQVVYKCGKIDILVNNAYFGGPGKLEEISEDSWQQGIDGTINSVFRCTKEIIPFMKKTNGGSIINIASMYGMVSPVPEVYSDSGYDNPPYYGAGKAAVIQFTRYTACHLAKYGIRVNTVSPGPFPNDEVKKNEAFIRRLKEKVPLGRMGIPSELKGVIVLLASDASSFITGVNIPVDGGWTAW